MTRKKSDDSSETNIEESIETGSDETLADEELNLRPTTTATSGDEAAKAEPVKLEKDEDGDPIAGQKRPDGSEILPKDVKGKGSDKFVAKGRCPNCGNNLKHEKRQGLLFCQHCNENFSVPIGFTEQKKQVKELTE